MLGQAEGAGEEAAENLRNFRSKTQWSICLGMMMRGSTSSYGLASRRVNSAMKYHKRRPWPSLSLFLAGQSQSDNVTIS